MIEFRHYLGETDNTIGPSMMLFNIRAASLWNRNTDYNEVLRDICRHYYGPAAPEMLDYYIHMHQQMLTWELPQGTPTPFVGDAVEYTLAKTVAGRKFLDAARKKAAKEFVAPADLANPAIYPPDEVVAKSQSLIDVGEALRLYDEAWTAIQAA